MILDDAARARLYDRFGPSVGPWCDELPALVERLAKRWSLTVVDAKPGNTGRTLICDSPDGPRVLKLTPDQEIAASEATALQSWASCSRVVQVIEVDFEAGAILLERLEPGTTLVGQDVPWAQIGELLTQIHGVPALGPFPSMPDRVTFMYDLAERRLGGLLPVEMLHRARDRAHELAAGGPVALIHSDLHPGNVLDAGPDRGAVAIDPRPCLGDPAFDTVDWVFLPMAAGGSLDDGIAALRPHVPDLDVDRVRGWCVAMAPLVAMGPLRRGGPTPFTEAVLELAR